ncbi:MAG: hypothetical protein E6G92_10005 [Alphaproteobacteria bacterium]|nr:MAG: hypothetical protein E6G92_10005 [Alphaproteobacteria bacterium]
MTRVVALDVASTSSGKLASLTSAIMFERAAGIVRRRPQCHAPPMMPKTGFEPLMRLVCEQWCLGQSIDSGGNASDVRRFIPKSGQVTADQFVEWVFRASGNDAREDSAMWQRAKAEIRAAFVRCMGGETVDAGALRWPGGPDRRFLPLPDPEAFARKLTQDELKAHGERYGEGSRERILVRRELDRRRRRLPWAGLVGIVAPLVLVSAYLVFVRGPLPGPAGLPDQPTLCQLAEHRSDYAGRTLMIEGYFLASQHGSSVGDPRCGYGIGVTWRGGRTPGLRRLGDLGERFRSEGMMILVRVTGEAKQDRSASLGGEQPWLLDLSDAPILRAQPIAEADEERYLSWLEGPSPSPFQPSR